MPTLELKIPPVAVWLISAGPMWLVSRGFPAFDFAIPARRTLAAGLTLIGLVIGLLGVVSFRKAGTTVNPLKPDSSSALVASGIYRLTRNPMYEGLLLTLVGWATFLANLLAFLWLPLFILYMNRFQIIPEERALATRFGADFTGYKSRVRRWL